jgi:hypothetical protein
LSSDGKTTLTRTGLEGYRRLDISPNYIQNPRLFWYLPELVPSSIAHTNRQQGKVNRSTINDLGGITALSPKPIEVVMKGQSVGLIPLRTSSEKYRYYQANKGFFAGDRRTGTVTKIYNEDGRPEFLSDNNALIISDTYDGQKRVIRIGPEMQPEILHQGLNLEKVLDVDTNGDVMLLTSSGICVFDKFNKEIICLSNGNFDAKFFHFGKERFIIGFATLRSPDKTNANTTPVIWNKDGKPVAISAQCTGLKGKIVRVQSLMNARILCNKNGWVALEISGRNPDSGQQKDLYTGWNQKEEWTYLLKAIPPRS